MLSSLLILTFRLNEPIRAVCNIPKQKTIDPSEHTLSVVFWGDLLAFLQQLNDTDAPIPAV